MRSSLSRRRLPLFGLSAVFGLVAASFAAIPAQAAVTSYSGNAYAVGLTGVTVAGVGVTDQLVGFTQPLPPAGGTLNGSVGTVTLPGGLGTATVVLEQTSGGGTTSTSTSQVAGVTILPTTLLPTGVLGATVLNANSSVVNCGAPTLASSVATLSINGTTITLPPNPAPNTLIVVGPPTAPIATVTLNAQASTGTPPTTSAGTVSALVVDFPATGPLAPVITGTITISQAHSDQVCTAAPPPTPTPTPAPTPAPTATPTAPPSLPITGAGPGQPPVNGSGSALLALGLLLLVSASSTGFLVWRRRSSHLTD